jgi:hypothetical protein
MKPFIIQRKCETSEHTQRWIDITDHNTLEEAAKRYFEIQEDGNHRVIKRIVRDEILMPETAV